MNHDVYGRPDFTMQYHCVAFSHYMTLHKLYTVDPKSVHIFCSHVNFMHYLYIHLATMVGNILRSLLVLAKKNKAFSRSFHEYEFVTHLNWD